MVKSRGRFLFKNQLNVLSTCVKPIPPYLGAIAGKQIAVAINDIHSLYCSGNACWNKVYVPNLAIKVLPKHSGYWVAVHLLNIHVQEQVIEQVSLHLEYRFWRHAIVENPMIAPVSKNDSHIVLQGVVVVEEVAIHLVVKICLASVIFGVVCAEQSSTALPVSLILR